jgi:two-component system phosphate regulon sensor histidine kinase PhoR
MNNPPRLSIRFQISLVLLLSALNGIVLFTFSATLLARAEDPHAVARESLQRRVSNLNDLVHTGTQEEVDAGFEDLVHALSDEDTEHSTPAVAQWELDASTWVGADRPTAGVDRVRDGHMRVLGALAVDLESAQGTDRKEVRRLFTAMMIWVVLSSALLVITAVRIRWILSAPLTDLANAARRVADGQLVQPIPQVGHSREISDLRDSLEAMRLNLSQSIEELDHKNGVVLAMLEALADGVLLTDADGKVIDHNAAGARYFQTMAGKPLRQQSTPATVALDPDYFQRRATQNQVDVTDGTSSVRHFDVSVKPLASRAVDSSHLVVIRDVTQAVQLESLKREFLSVITHELKTPLTAIQGFVKLLLMGKGGELSAKQNTLLTRTLEQVHSLNRMVQDLLDTTRLDGGDLPFDFVLVEVGQAARDAHGAFAPTALGRGLKLDLSVELPDELVSVRTDTMRLQQILGNLIRNAIKFTPSGGKVGLRVALKDDGVVFEVSDTGRGVPTDALPHLFQKFYQVERGDTRRSGGAGLGLYICEQLASEMGGRMSVVSQVGRGSTFTLWVPRAHPDVEEEAP